MPNCCTRCFSDTEIQRYIEFADAQGDCNYCGSTNVPICDVRSVGSFIFEGIEKCYEEAANQVTYESAEGGYQMPTHTITEILKWELNIFGDALSDPTRLIADLIEDDGTPYVNRDPYGPPPGEPEELYQWEQFRETIIGQQRFTAFLRAENREDDERHPARFMHELAEYLNGHDLISSIPQEKIIYRARVYDARIIFHHADLTSPPRDKTRNNRMSPAGISFFYGCLDVATAVAEVRPNVGDQIAVAEFVARRPLRLLDLSRPDEEPLSIFNEFYVFGYEEFFKPFLRHFAADIAKPIRPFESDILYVPTQAFTEFIRMHEFRNSPGNDRDEPTFHVDGILYRSSLKRGGTNVVLFRGSEISTTRTQNDAEAWLQYNRYHIYELDQIAYSATRIRQTRRRHR